MRLQPFNDTLNIHPPNPNAWALLLRYVSQKFEWEFSTVGPNSKPSILHFIGRYQLEQRLRSQEIDL